MVEEEEEEKKKKGGCLQQDKVIHITLWVAAYGPLSVVLPLAVYDPLVLVRPGRQRQLEGVLLGLFVVESIDLMPVVEHPRDLHPVPVRGYTC